MSKTYTTNFNLTKLDQGDIEWDTDVNGNMDTIDAKIYDPESHTHINIEDLNRLGLDAASGNMGQITVGDVITADADATYGTAERDLINELKSTVNTLLSALHQGSGCGVLGSSSSSSYSSSSASVSASTSVSSSSASTSASTSTSTSTSA